MLKTKLWNYYNKNIDQTKTENKRETKKQFEKDFFKKKNSKKIL